MLLCNLHWIQVLLTMPYMSMLLNRMVAVASHKSQQTRLAPKAPEEVAEAHEAWQLAMEEAQEGNESLGKVAVERLLLGSAWKDDPT